MSTISLPTNLNDVDASGDFKVAAPGEYTMEIKKAEVKTSSNNNQMINVGMQIIDDDDYTGTYVWETLVLIDSCMFKLKQFMLSAGMDVEEAELDLEDWIGETVQGVVDVETYTANDGEEKEKNVVKKYIF